MVVVNNGQNALDAGILVRSSGDSNAAGFSNHAFLLTAWNGATNTLSHTQGSAFDQLSGKWIARVARAAGQLSAEDKNLARISAASNNSLQIVAPTQAWTNAPVAEDMFRIINPGQSHAVTTFGSGTPSMVIQGELMDLFAINDYLIHELSGEIRTIVSATNSSGTTDVVFNLPFTSASNGDNVQVLCNHSYKGAFYDISKDRWAFANLQTSVAQSSAQVQNYESIGASDLVVAPDTAVDASTSFEGVTFGDPHAIGSFKIAVESGELVVRKLLATGWSTLAQF